MAVAGPGGWLECVEQLVSSGLLVDVAGAIGTQDHSDWIVREGHARTGHGMARR